MAKTNQDKNTRKHTGKGRGSDSNGSAIQNIRTLWNEMNSEPSDTTGQGMSRGELIRFGFGAILFLVSCFILLSIASHLVTAGADDGFPKYEGARAANWMGEWGLYTARFFIDRCWGVPSFLIPLFLLATSLRIMQIYKVRLWKWFLNCAIIMIWMSALGYYIQDLLPDTTRISLHGNIGEAEVELLKDKIGSVGAFFALIVALIVYMIYLSSETIIWVRRIFHLRIKNGQTQGDILDGEDIDPNDLFENAANQPYTGLSPDETATTIEFHDLDKAEAEELASRSDSMEMEVQFNDPETSQPAHGGEYPDMEIHKGQEEAEADLDDLRTLEPYDPKLDLENYQYPTIDLLRHYDVDTSIDMEEQQQNKNQIIRVLSDFGVKISSIKATVGPAITLYEITPAPGVRISKIRNLEDDIALSLRALGIRIIAPIPGKGTIGIEVPNAKPQIVSMESIINSRKFQETQFELPMALGKTITNEIYMADLAKMPHLLVAGATGQGKSVGLNAIITSLLYKKHPAELKIVMVDPKKVEFSVYSPIVNHFLAQVEGNEDDEPIITDVQKVVQTLKSLCIEMDTRYDLLKKAGSRNIKEYNQKFKARQLNPKNGHRFMPYIVVIIDEFGDLIMTAGKEVELPICRIAQLARAVGIHMIIATQRPTTNIITGTIKANFPARIAFKCTAMIDSRTILDRPGAQQLVGKGDMLILAGNEPVRIQCAFVDTPEVEAITHYIASQQSYNHPAALPPVPLDSDDSDSPDVDMDKLDPMFEEVARLVVQTQQGSTSMIQRKFSIGYNRAGRLMDQLEVAGIVGPAHGSKPREVIVRGDMELDTLLMNMK